MFRFEQASSEEKIPLGQRTVFFFQMYCFPPIYMKQYMRLYRASCEKRIFFFAAIDYSRRHEVEMEEGSRLYLSSPFVFDHDEREENYIFQINSFLRIARILLIHQNNYKFVRLMDDIEVNTFYPY